MRRDLAIAWVVSVCSLSLRKSQAKTLSILVAAAMRVQRVSMANIGRSMGGMVKHQIKRCWRFCSNQRIETADAMRPIVATLLKKRKKKLLDYPVKRGIAKVLRRVNYRSDGALTQSVVVHWPVNLPEKRDECWFLMTDQPGTARQLCKLYGQRMTIEQLFRDNKSKRNGWSLRDTQITKPDRIDRMLLILAIAYLLLCGIGLIAKTLFPPSQWCSTNRNRECSIYTIGIIMLEKIRASPQRLLAAVMKLSEIAAPNWG